MADMTPEIPSAEELLRRAEAMIPALLERAVQVERDRMVSREIIAEMTAAGFFRVLQPRRWGGYEMNPIVYLEIIMRLAQGCMSTAWIYGVQGAQPFMLVKFDERAQQDVWGGDADTLMCSTLQPSTSVVKVVEGGYRLSGRWSYLSGSHYSEWLGVGGVLPEDSAKPGERRLFLLPRSDWQIVDVWDVTGLAGTGSNDVTVTDAFVPAHRTAPYRDVTGGPALSSLAATPLVYRVPLAQVFLPGITTTAVGALQGMFTLFLKHAATRVSVNGSKALDDPNVQLLCAETANALDELTLVMRRNFAEMTAYAESGALPPLSERMKYKFQISYSVERCCLLAARLFKAAGSSAIFNNREFARILANINAGRQHISCQWEGIGRNWGVQMLGGTPGFDPML